jgi:hypothetical protein
MTPSVGRRLTLLVLALLMTAVAAVVPGKVA